MSFPISRLLTALSVFAALLIFGFFFLQIKASIETEARAELRLEMAEVTDVIEREIDTVINDIRAFVAFFEASSLVTERDFAEYVAQTRMLSAQSNVRAVAVVPFVTRNRLPAVQSMLRNRAATRKSLGYPAIVIEPEAGRDLYAPVLFAESRKGRKDIVGYDLATNAARFETARAALFDSEVWLTAPVLLAQDEPGDMPSVLVMAAAAEANIGFGATRLLVAMSYTPGARIENVLGAKTDRQFAVEVMDVSVDGAQLIYRSPDIAAAPEILFEQALAFGGRLWRIRYFAGPAVIASTVPAWFWVLGFVGMVLLVALGIAVERLQRSRALLSTHVHARTAELLASRDQIRLIADNMPAAITYIDAAQRFAFVNRTASEWLSRPADEIVGKSAAELLGPPYENVRPRVEAALAGQPQSFVATIRYPDGVTRDTRANYVPDIGADGSVNGYFALIEDVSELRTAERQLRQAQKMEAVGQLTGGVAHDFNNLLGVILGQAERLGMLVGDDDRAQDYISRLNQAVERGASLTQRLLSFSRQQVLTPATEDIGDLLHGLEDLLGRTLGETLALDVKPDPDLWPVSLDAHQFENALLNLALNARNAMPHGGTLEISASNVVLDEAFTREQEDLVPGEYVKVSVRDSGEGIPAGLLDRVFEPFFTTRDGGEGSGLGLSMVYGFVMQSHGHVAIDSAPGRGTTVALYLPRSHEMPAEDNTPVREREPVAGSGRVLVVEDDAMLRAIPVEVFENGGFEVVAVADGETAIRCLEERGPFDLMFTDIVLPGINGIETAARAETVQPDIKVLFATGYAEDVYEELADTGQAANVISKPYRGADLLSAADRLLNGRRT